MASNKDTDDTSETNVVVGLVTDDNSAIADDGDKSEPTNGHVKGTGGQDSPDSFPFKISGRSTYRTSTIAGTSSREESVDERFKTSTADLDSYDFNHSRRGEAIIINNRHFEKHLDMDERRGTDRDADNLYETFQLLGFDVKKYHNVKKRQLSAIIDSALSTDYSDSDCFALAVLSHGDDGVIYTTDDMVNISDLTHPFRGDNCKTLAGKPKLFFFQACRGHKLDPGQDVTDSEVAADEVDARKMHKIPVMADFLLAYSVVPGHYSWRNSDHGSWFIQSLCHVLRRHHARLDLLSMMTRVNRHVAYDFQSNATTWQMTGKKQIPSIVSMLTKDVWFSGQPQ